MDEASFEPRKDDEADETTTGTGAPAAVVADSPEERAKALAASAVRDDEELSRGQRLLAWWRSIWGIAATTLLLLILLGTWQGRAAYTAAKDWRARQLLAKAEAAEAGGNETEARRLLRQATALVGAQPTTLRAVARYCARQHDPAALAYYEALDKTGHADADDWIDYTRQAFRARLLPKAERGLQALEKFPAAAARSPVLALQAERLALDGRWPEALAIARAALAAAPAGADGEARLLCARLLLRPPLAPAEQRAPRQKEGLALLGELATQPNEYGLHALRMLQGLTNDPSIAPLLRGADVSPWMAAAARNPGADATTRIKCWDLRLAAQPERREEITQELLAAASSASGADQLEIARWLTQHRAHELAKKLTAPSKVKSEDWFMVYLDAIAGLGDWETVRAEVSSASSVPLPAAIRRLFQLRAESELGRQPNVDFAWNAITIALGSATPKQQLYIAGYAEQTGFASQAAPIYRRLLREKAFPPSLGRIPDPQRLACYLGAVRTASSGLATEELARLFTEFASEFPEMDEVQNDAAYLRLLLREGIAEATTVSRRLAREHPELLAYRTTAALADLRAERAGEAARWYENLQFDWKGAPERFKAVWVAVLAANAREDEAAQLRATLNADTLRLEEKTLAGLP